MTFKFASIVLGMSMLCNQLHASQSELRTKVTKQRPMLKARELLLQQLEALKKQATEVRLLRQQLKEVKAAQVKLGNAYKVQQKSLRWNKVRVHFFKTVAEKRKHLDCMRTIRLNKSLADARKAQCDTFGEYFFTNYHASYCLQKALKDFHTEIQQLQCQCTAGRLNNQAELAEYAICAQKLIKVVKSKVACINPNAAHFKANKTLL